MSSSLCARRTAAAAPASMSRDSRQRMREAALAGTLSAASHAGARLPNIVSAPLRLSNPPRGQLPAIVLRGRPARSNAVPRLVASARSTARQRHASSYSEKQLASSVPPPSALPPETSNLTPPPPAPPLSPRRAYAAHSATVQAPSCRRAAEADARVSRNDAAHPPSPPHTHASPPSAAATRACASELLTAASAALAAAASSCPPSYDGHSSNEASGLHPGGVDARVSQPARWAAAAVRSSGSGACRSSACHASVAAACTFSEWSRKDDCRRRRNAVGSSGGSHGGASAEASAAALTSVWSVVMAAQRVSAAGWRMKGHSRGSTRRKSAAPLWWDSCPIPSHGRTASAASASPGRAAHSCVYGSSRLSLAPRLITLPVEAVKSSSRTSAAHTAPSSRGNSNGTVDSRCAATPSSADAAAPRTSSSPSCNASMSSGAHSGRSDGSRSGREARVYLRARRAPCRTSHTHSVAIVSNARATAAAPSIARTVTAKACAAVSRTGAVTRSPAAQSPKRSSAITLSSLMAQSSSHCARNSAETHSRTPPTLPALDPPAAAPCRRSHFGWKREQRSSAQRGSNGQESESSHDTLIASDAVSPPTSAWTPAAARFGCGASDVSAGRGRLGASAEANGIGAPPPAALALACAHRRGVGVGGHDGRVRRLWAARRPKGFLFLATLCRACFGGRDSGAGALAAPLAHPTDPPAASLGCARVPRARLPNPPAREPRRPRPPQRARPTRRGGARQSGRLSGRPRAGSPPLCLGRGGERQQAK
eukprot:scaffold6308_cov111-Isochrysis_galbana.AAC.6